MKIQIAILTMIAMAALAVVGCSKQTVSVDTAKLQEAFQSAEPAAKAAVDTAVSAIKNADYSGAVTQLQALAGKYKLTDAQQAAVKDAIASVQKAIADMAGKAAGDASKAAGDASKAASDATKALPK
jgi:PBP1b-binding outer membrane lipoprotein LpoB